MNPVRDAAILRRRLRHSFLAGLILVAGGCGDDPVDPDPQCADAPALPFGRTLPGSLDAGDALFDGSRIDYYSVRPESVGTLTVEMAAELPTGESEPAVDPFLYLWAAGLGDPVAQGYDPTGEGPLRTARLVAEVTPGCYRIGASGWPSAANGEYTLRVDFDPGA